MAKLIKTLISSNDIQKRVAELGAQITADYPDPERPLLLVSILSGSVIFFSDLVRQIRREITIDFISASSYGNSDQTSGEVRLLKDLDQSINGKDVLIVEDIIDTGLTLQCLIAALSSRNPASLKTCCLIDKPARRKTQITADYVGFTLKDDFFLVGYGLDFAQKFRNLPDICAIEPPVK